MRPGAWAAIAAIWIVMTAHALFIRLKMLADAAPTGARDEGGAVPGRQDNPLRLRGPRRRTA